MEQEIKFKTIRRKAAWPAIVIILLLGMGTGVWFFIYKNGHGQSDLTSTSPSPSLNDGIYRGRGMTFKYPKDWNVKEKDGVAGFLTSASIEVLRGEKGGEDSGYYDISWESRPNPRQLSLKEFAAEFDPQIGSYTRSNTLEIDGREAIYYGDTEEESTHFPVLTVFIKKNDREIVVGTLHWFYDLKNENLAPVFDRILSTLKFDG